jgi:hypothetical protein
MTGLQTSSAVPIATPSPLVGEGIAAARHNHGSVRGSAQQDTLPRQPLTRLRFAIADAKHRRRFKKGGQKAAHASPTRGEGKMSAIQRRRPT